MTYFRRELYRAPLFEDRGWEKVRALASRTPIACSLHGYAEVVAAIHRKLREGVLTPSQYRHVLRQFAVDCDEGAYRWLPLSPTVIERVKLTYEGLPRTVFLRAADAIHLACASENRFREIYSNDVHLLAGAEHFDLKGVDIL